MDLDQDFKEFIQLLNVNKVQYLIVGGYAVAFHGYVRYTGDIDFWVKPEKENLDRLVKSLVEFGFSAAELEKEELNNENLVFQFGVPPSRFDIMTSATGLVFDESWKARKELEMEDEKLNFISLEHLKINKQKAGRTRDLNDLENLGEEFTPAENTKISAPVSNEKT